MEALQDPPQERKIVPRRNERFVSIRDAMLFLENKVGEDIIVTIEEEEEGGRWRANRAPRTFTYGGRFEGYETERGSNRKCIKLGRGRRVTESDPYERGRIFANKRLYMDKILALS